MFGCKDNNLYFHDIYKHINICDASSLKAFYFDIIRPKAVDKAQPTRLNKLTQTYSVHVKIRQGFCFLLSTIYRSESICHKTMERD